MTFHHSLEPLTYAEGREGMVREGWDGEGMGGREGWGEDGEGREDGMVRGWEGWGW